MCGICGIIHDDPARAVQRDHLARMNRTMVHRGPDDEGFYLGRGAGLGMRRLSIIDVSGGHQPMASESGKIQAVCNGEIYNFQEIRDELIGKGHAFHSRSDSEVLPHLYEEVGALLPTKLNGMFGLAVWDEPNRTLVLARDRMGEKPLFWSHQNGIFLFGSELKALLAHPELAVSTDRAALSRYLAYEYIPAPHTIFEGVYKLEPAHALIYRNGSVEVKPYWGIPVGEENEGISEETAREELLGLLSRSVKRRLISDVPLGVFLSGGIDSSTVVAMMTRHMNPNDVKTFSISFEEKSFDESSYARRVAEHFHTDHREQACTPADLLALMPRITGLLDEPFADPSIVPTYALSLFTREHVTVALGGDGGDELFAGYPTFQAERAARWYRLLPRALRRGVIGPIGRALPVSDKNISFDFKVKKFIKGAEIDDPSIRHAVWMGAFSLEDLNELLAFDPGADVFADALRCENAATAASPGNRLLYVYKKLYLAEDILAKVDWASMGASLEARAPLLDHEIVEFAARLPYRMKLKGFKMKYLLKKAVGDLLPKGIAGRGKKGFGIPVAKWMKGPLKEMTCDLLAKDKIRREGFFRPESVARLVEDHMKSRADNRQQLWSLFMFEQWLDRWGSTQLAK